MLLAVDVGNTNVVFALFDGLEIRSRWRVATDPRRTADQYAVWLLQLMQLQGFDHPAQRIGSGFEVVWDGDRLVIRYAVHISHPQAMLELLAPRDGEALQPSAAHHHQAGVRRRELADQRQRPYGVEHLHRKAIARRLASLSVVGGSGGFAYLRAFNQRHHAKRRAMFVALANHVQIAHLKYAQRKQASGEKHTAKRKKW